MIELLVVENELLLSGPNKFKSYLIIIPLGLTGGSHESITAVVERLENVLIIGADSGTMGRNKKDENNGNLRNTWITMKNVF